MYIFVRTSAYFVIIIHWTSHFIRITNIFIAHEKMQQFILASAVWTSWLPIRSTYLQTSLFQRMLFCLSFYLPWLNIHWHHTRSATGIIVPIYRNLFLLRYSFEWMTLVGSNSILAAVAVAALPSAHNATKIRVVMDQNHNDRRNFILWKENKCCLYGMMSYCSR